MRLNGLDHIAHPLHHRLETEGGRGIAEAVLGRVAHLVCNFGTFDQRFARHTAVVQAVAAHLVHLDQRDLGFDGCRNVGADQTARTTANDDQVAVKSLGALVGPAGINLALLHSGHNAARDQREEAQQHKAAPECGTQNALQRFELRQLRARVHIHRRARQHADLADPVIRPHLHARQTHEQVDQEERHHRNQAQSEQVKTAFAFHACVDVDQALTKACLHPVAQQKARRQKRQGRAHGGRKRHHQQALPKPKHRATGQSDDHGPRNGQRCRQHIDQAIHRRHRERLRGVQQRKTGLTGFELLKAQETSQVQRHKRADGQRQQEEQNNLAKAHENSKGVGD